MKRTKESKKIEMLDNTMGKSGEIKQKRQKRIDNVRRSSGLKFYIGKCIEQSLQPDKNSSFCRLSEMLDGRALRAKILT